MELGPTVEIPQEEKSGAQIEEVLNGIVSMLALVTGEKSENLILAFCEKLSKAPTGGSSSSSSSTEAPNTSNSSVGKTCLKVLWSLYQSLDEASPMRFHVYYYSVQLAGRLDEIDTVYKSMDHVKSQISNCNPSNEQLQKLLRLLHQVLLNAGKSEDASEVMIELLGTYTTGKRESSPRRSSKMYYRLLSGP